MENLNRPPEEKKSAGKGIISVIVVVLFALAVIAIFFIIDFLFGFK